MPDSTPARDDAAIHIAGARQNNLKNLTLRLPLNELIVVTGVSGSGKSSLVFDTLYAEGQRRYVETFSPYARQFLDRMDKPQVDRIDGVPPAIAIDQTNPVRTSRSTVGTMTELNDHLKLLYARAAQLHCRGCGQPVRSDTPVDILSSIRTNATQESIQAIVITFPVAIPANFSEEEVRGFLQQQGYTRVHARRGEVLEIVQDRVRLGDDAVRAETKTRVIESLEAALKLGRGRVAVHDADDAAKTWRFSAGLHCAQCDIDYTPPTPAMFSFNSPIGACETCRGFGRSIGVDYGLVIPDERKSLRDGAIKPWQTQSFKECQDDLEKYAKKRGLPLDVPWRDLPQKVKDWVIGGDEEWVSWRKSEGKHWYGARRFFDWLESKAYKMHIRVLLSKYRAYTDCTACGGARLKPEGLLWRLGGNNGSRGYTVHELMLLSIDRLQSFFRTISLPAPLDQATELLLGEINARIDYLCNVGLSYLTLDRQSRTLSGGEVQRINLTTALGTSLVNTLFVLDEPSIGLHPRDMGRVIGIMQRLRDAGNSLVVVEHDPQIMFAADRILDLGPGPGERGGEIVSFGTPQQLLAVSGSLTAQYLAGSKVVSDGAAAASTAAQRPPARLEILGVTERNLKNIDVAIPLNRLVCITGVSGSGKSTLMQDVLYAALRKHQGKPTEAPGAYHALRGTEAIGDIVMVDQTPIGRTTRSNPASYVGAFDAIRKLFCDEPLARERKYTPGTFSFNAGTGRCPTCSGNGFEHIEMQFLSDVYLRCPDCNGRRYRDEVLEVKVLPAGQRSSKSIADALEMTAAQALAFFAENDEVRRTLEPLVAVGLDYLKLGQPVPTLSGGEAQRLKLAGHLAEANQPKTKRSPQPSKKAPTTLFLFDEPTTGLHFDDIAKLLRALRRLQEAGHSLLIIEHNLDVIRAADWIIDLGPEGGDAGGEIVCTGAPAEVMRHASSHTAAALRDYEQSLQKMSRAAATLAVNEAAPAYAALPAEGNSIQIHHAREHNLKNIDLAVPREKFTVITGVSGSGKSTVAFDILFAEGQRRYLESLNAYARQFVQPASRPDVDAIYGIPPTVAIEQRTSRGGRKSTVATLTEIYHFLRLLFVKLGTQYCPDCNVAIEPQSLDVIAANLLRSYRDSDVEILSPLVIARKGYYTDLAKWAHGKGHAHLRVDGELLPTAKWPRLDRFKEHTIELPVGVTDVSPKREANLRELLQRGLDAGRGVVHVLPQAHNKRAKQAQPKGIRKAASRLPVVFSTKRACPSCSRSFPELDPRLFSFNSKHGWCASCYGTGVALPNFDEEQSGEEIWWNEWFEGEAEPCDACAGKRLNAEALAIRFRERSIADLTALSVEQAGQFFNKLALKGREADIARDLLAELRSRLSFLQQVGLAYLALDRAAPTLSGGEAQRIRLAAQLGSNLRGVCYILDEPTIGLHPRDNRILLDTLAQLNRKGNTLVVVEHDEETIRRAEHLIDLGPSAGKNGGRLVAQGDVHALEQAPESITGRFLKQPLLHPLRPPRATTARTPALAIKGAKLHNLANVNARVPLERLVCVTGVSGSGKSTLVRDVLRVNMEYLVSRQRKKRGAGEDLDLSGCRSIDGWEAITRVLEVDQTPIGKTPRSCPATYVGFWDDIRKAFANTSEARMRGYTPARFSFNVSGGRCEVCEGQGLKTIEMSFLPDVKVLCEGCGGARFNNETLAVRFKEKTIGEVLAMSVDEAVEFFAANRSIHHPLTLLQDVGLGYLTLGQQSPTLSGGEAQRIKLVTELAKSKPQREMFATKERASSAVHTLYVLDEPTVGLHMADIEKLIHVLHRLVDAGNTVVVIEHNLDVIAEADWIIDLGPEGGSGGGRVVAQGTPLEVVQRKRDSHTALVLAEFLATRGTQDR